MVGEYEPRIQLPLHLLSLQISAMKVITYGDNRICTEGNFQRCLIISYFTCSNNIFHPKLVDVCAILSITLMIDMPYNVLVTIDFSQEKLFCSSIQNNKSDMYLKHTSFHITCCSDFVATVYLKQIEICK